MTRDTYEAFCAALGMEPVYTSPAPGGPYDASKVEKMAYHPNWPDDPPTVEPK